MAFRPIHVSGDIAGKDEWYTAGVAITPGMQVETYDDSGETLLRPQSSSTDVQSRRFALEKIGRSIDEAYAIGEVVPTADFLPGSIVNAIIASGQDIATLEKMQGAGDGTLKAATADTAAANVAVFQAVERPGAVTANTRCMVQIIS